MIRCEDINSEITKLKIKLNQCSMVSGADLINALDIIEAIRNCESQSVGYDHIKQDHYYSTDKKVVVTYPVDSFHAMSICVMSGSITYSDFDFQAGTVRNIEFTSLNKEPMTFVLNPGGSVFVEYITDKV